MNKLIFLTALTLVAFSSCKEDKVEPGTPAVAPTLEVKVQPVFGSTSLQSDVAYTTAEGYEVKFTDLKFFMTNVSNGTNVLTSAALFDWMETGTSFISVKGDKANFSSLSANLGVGATENHADPSAFPNDNVLNIAIANDMHWSWNPGYIFMKVEAKVDTIPDGTALFDHNVVFHVGLDVNLQSWSVSGLTWATMNASTSRATLKLDLEKFLQNNGQNIDLKTEFSTHSASGQEALSLKVIENFKAAIGKL